MKLSGRVLLLLWALVLAAHTPLAMVALELMFGDLKTWDDLKSDVLTPVTVFLLPISLLMWRERALLSERSMGAARDLWPTGLGLGLAAAGTVLQWPPLQTLSLPLCVHGLLRVGLQREAADRFVLPLYMLVTVLPMGGMSPWEGWLSTQACRVAASIGGGLLQLASYPATVEGTIVYTRGVANHVFPPCSGLTIFGSLLYLGLWVGSMWRVPLGAILQSYVIVMPLAVIGNASRVSVVSAAYEHLGRPTRWAHDGPSAVTAALCFWLLIRRLRAHRRPADSEGSGAA